MRVAADLGTHVDQGKKGTKGMDKDVVVDGGSERSNIGCWIVGNVAMQRDEVEEILVYKFFLQVPKLLVILVNDGILVWVVVVGSGAGEGGKEVGKEVSGNRGRWWFDGKR